MKGKRGTSFSVHTGKHNNQVTWIITASNESHRALARDVLEGAAQYEACSGRAPEVVEASARHENGRFYVAGEGRDLVSVVAVIRAKLLSMSSQDAVAAQ